MSCLNKSGKYHTYNRHYLESIELTWGNTATHPPNYFINGQQRQTTANSANLKYPRTLRLRSLQPDQPRTLPNGGFSTHDSSLSHLNQNFVLFQILYHKWFINRKLLYLIPTSYQLRLALNFSYHAFIFISVFISCVVLMLNYRYISIWWISDHPFIFLPTLTKLIKLSFSKANVVWVCLWQPL